MDVNQSLYHVLCEDNVSFQRFFSTLTESSSIYIAYRTKDYHTLWANEALINSANTPLDRLQKNKCYEVVYNLKKPCKNCALQKSIETGKAVTSEIVRPGGIISLMRSFPLKDKDNKIVNYLKISIDITKQLNLEEKLKNQKLKMDFFTRLSHEFKTPVHIMHTALQVLEHKIQNDSLSRETLLNKLSAMKQNNFRLMKMINNLLDFNKMDYGHYKQCLKKYDIVKLIKSIVSSSKDYARDQGKIIKFNSQVKEKMLMCDAFDIERIILNLLSNAFKNTDEGDTISVNIKDKGSSVSIMVIDTGHGIPREKQKNIFKEFEQGDDSTIRKHEGSGLGLSIVERLVKMHNGEIYLHSEPGKGSMFLIELPVKDMLEKENEETKIKSNLTNMINIEFSDIYC